MTAPKKYTENIFRKKLCCTIQNGDLNIILRAEGSAQLTAR